MSNIYPDDLYTMYEKAPARSGATPFQLWGYNALYQGDIVEVACWAHARRKFVEAEKSDRRASGILLLVQKLYRVEKEN